MSRSLSQSPSHSIDLRLAAMAVLVLLGLTNVYRFLGIGVVPDPTLRNEETALGVFPQTAGKYTLARSWNENLMTGALLFHWAEYAPEGGGTHIALGVSPMLGSHDTMICHSARGEDPIWHGQSTFRTSAQPISFSSSFYNDGATQFLEATTLCNGTSCGEYSSPRTHFGFVYSKPQAATFLGQDAGRPIPILLRAETIDTTLPPDTARTQLSSDLSSFLAQINLDDLTKPYRRN